MIRCQPIKCRSLESATQSDTGNSLSYATQITIQKPSQLHRGLEYFHISISCTLLSKLNPTVLHSVL